MILERVVQPVWVVDEAGLIRFANASAATALGYGHASDLLGLPSHQIVHHKEFHAEGDLVRRDGSLLPIEFWSAPIDLPDGRGAVVSFTDITERQRAAQELMVSRARLVTASYAARQQVTRDLHDGAQQRFVSAIIGLQIAQRKWESEPRRARELVDLALSDAMHGMDELRELAAGIHPAILTQRGLAAALAGLTGRLPVPVQLDLPGHRLPAPIEATVYFFCAEALTNVVKHAQAGSAWVNVTADGDQCVVQVGDDGIGGARARSDSSGLTGLRDRITALNGVMNILAPAEGGTVLHAAIPLPHQPAGAAGPVP